MNKVLQGSRSLRITLSERSLESDVKRCRGMEFWFHSFCFQGKDSMAEGHKISASWQFVRKCKDDSDTPRNKGYFRCLCCRQGCTLPSSFYFNSIPWKMRKLSLGGEGVCPSAHGQWTQSWDQNPDCLGPRSLLFAVATQSTVIACGLSLLPQCLMVVSPGLMTELSSSFWGPAT